MKRFQILIPVALLLAAALSLVMKRAQTRTNEMIQEAESGIQTWKKSEALQQVEDAERRFEEATGLLRAKDPVGSYRAYYLAVGKVSHYVEHYPDKEIKDGLTLKRWFEEHDQPYRKAVAEHFPDALKSLQEGVFPADQARQLKNSYQQAGFDEIAKLYQSAEADIVAARAKFAPTRLYVHISETGNGYPEMLRALIEDRWSDTLTFQAIYGGTLGQAEQSAAWKQLNINVSQHFARYEVQGSQRAKQSVSPPQIPERVEITFRMSGSTEIPTSWDKLPPFKASVDVPKSLWLKPEFRNGGAEAESAIKKAQADVMEAIRKELASLPEFRLFPSIDPKTATLRTDKGLDLNIARAFYYSNKERLLADLKKIAESGDADALGDLPLIAVTLDLESMAESVTATLPSIDRRKRSETFRALSQNPAYGGYKPLLAYIRNPPPDDDAGQAIDALRGHWARPEIKSLFLEKIGDAKTKGRSRFTHALIEILPLDELASSASAWIQDPDYEFAGQVYHSVNARDLELSGRLLLDHFDKVQPFTQSRMLSSFRFDPDAHGKSIVELLQKATQSPDSKSIRQSAFDKLYRAAQSKHGWDALNELAAVEKDENTLGSIKVKLMANVRSVYPEKAREFMLAELKGGHAESRRQSIHFLLDSEEPNAEILKLAAAAIVANPSESQLADQAIQSIQRNFSRKGAWDFKASKEDLKTIAAAAMSHKFPRTRQAAYDVMGKVAKEGIAGFTDLLREALKTETVPNLKQQIDRLLSDLDRER